MHSGKPDERFAAARALAKLRSVDRAAALIFALTDPDRRVVRAARDGLQATARSFDGNGPPDNFDEDQRQAAIVQWKAWYAQMRPEEGPLP